ncbi:MAG: HYExAFE family protein [Planctomycetes bacterium]|nr:HYExAFE family protein [Planctomycetota bacterium]
MAQRRHHYEQAFEAYLRRRRIPYVAVDEAKKALLPGREQRVAGGGDEPLPALKSFDFVIYGQGGNLLAEVKGRRASGSRLECWVTRDDVESLSRWERLFGPEFQAAFVFVYWCEQQPPDALFQEVFEHQGRWYALRSVPVRDYARSMKPRSLRWGTLDLPREAYERISAPFAPSASRLGIGDAAPMLEALA